jgi:hypothetical protein
MRSFFAEYWSLTKARDWMCEALRILAEDAFQRLGALGDAGQVQIIGIATPDHPGELERINRQAAAGHRPFVDPIRPPEKEDIPTSEWPRLYLHGDGDLYDITTKLPMWRDPEVNATQLKGVLLPVIEQTEKEDHPASTEAEILTTNGAKGSSGRKKGSGSIDDTEKLREMLRLLADGGAKSVLDAARKVSAATVRPSQSASADTERLRHKFAKIHGTKPPEGQTWGDIADSLEINWRRIALQ